MQTLARHRYCTLDVTEAATYELIVSESLGIEMGNSPYSQQPF